MIGDPVLREVCAPITEITDGIRALVDDLVDTVKLPGRAGVAAPQIGVALRAFSYNIDGDIGYVLNPVLAEVRGEPQHIGEGCLSVPGLHFERRRHRYTKVTGIDLDGNVVELAGEGLMAQMLQHETDHLDGHLYIEGLEGETKREAMRQVRAAAWY